MQEPQVTGVAELPRKECALKITLVGAGHVGLSLGLFLAKRHSVYFLDSSEEKVAQINNRVSPIADQELIAEISNSSLEMIATTDQKAALSSAEMVIVCVPTNQDPHTGLLDSSIVSSVVLATAELAPNALVVIKSTVPIGTTQTLQDQASHLRLVFSPEFVREGSGLQDHLEPSRVVVGGLEANARVVADLMLEGIDNLDTPVVLCTSEEAEAIKLFSNAFLASRVAFFNEVDSFCLLEGISPKVVVQGVSLDPRIGVHYNNPSFGFGGYCLPKDTLEVATQLKKMGLLLSSATIESNEKRLSLIAQEIISRGPKSVGIYRLNMKADSSNVRESSSLRLLEKLAAANLEIAIYEPLIKDDFFNGHKVHKSLEDFKHACALIVANRITSELEGMESKLFSRDLFGIS